jgi:hypothetical protein
MQKVSGSELFAIEYDTIKQMHESDASIRQICEYVASKYTNKKGNKFSEKQLSNLLVDHGLRRQTRAHLGPR